MYDITDKEIIAENIIDALVNEDQRLKLVNNNANI